MFLFMYSTGYSCDILMKVKFSQQFFKKSSNIQFHENPSSGSTIVPCGWTDMMKLIVAVHNFTNMRSDENLG
jgi:hypothetical protein